MTKEEAITLLDDLIGMVEDNHNSDYDTALRMGIKAIECEPCNDAISRQAVLDCLKATNLRKFDFILEARGKIKSLPTVQPQPKMGRWEWVQYDGNPNIGNWHCSECNRIVCGAITAANPVYAYKYCPSCGAKMVDPQGETTDCSTCILDNTDACTRGAGRAVDDDACEDYLASPTGAESEDDKE